MNPSWNEKEIQAAILAALAHGERPRNAAMAEEVDKALGIGKAATGEASALGTLPKIDPFPELGKFGNFIPIELRRPMRWVVKDLLQRGVVTTVTCKDDRERIGFIMRVAARIAAGVSVTTGMEVREPGKTLFYQSWFGIDMLSEMLDLACPETSPERAAALRNLYFWTNWDHPKLALALVKDQGGANEEHIKLLADAASQPGLSLLAIDVLNEVQGCDRFDRHERDAVHALQCVAWKANVAILLGRSRPGDRGYGRRIDLTLNNGRQRDWVTGILDVSRERSNERVVFPWRWGEMHDFD